MIRVPAGSFWRGSDDARRPDEAPRHRVQLSAFELDETLVTIADYRAFVDATGHRTSAERFGYALVAVEGMKDWAWQRAAHASWRRPFGDLMEYAVSDDLPATAVGHDDANAYCHFLGKRLPTEAEWEYAMRAGSSDRYPWGPTPRRPDGRYGLNHWQGPAEGEEHSKNLLDDGFAYLSPVRAFPPNAWGFYDPVGNVWQLVADWYAPDTYKRAAAAGVVVDPQGPRFGKKRVTRGGSWWCSARTCSGFGLQYRGKNVPDAPFNNVGFRCARSIAHDKP